MQINHESSPKKKADVELSVNTIISDIKGKTPTEIRAYVDNKPMSVPDMRDFIEMFLLYIQSKEG